MTSDPVPRVDINSLGVQGELGSGGQGRVLAVNGLQINGRWPAALKIYSHSVIGTLNASALETITGFARQLTRYDRDWLDQNAAWPSVLVEDKRAICGFLMQRLPQAFYFDFQTRVTGTRQKPADVAFLLNSDSYVRSSGLSISDSERLVLLENLAATLSRLHSMGVAVGDMSPKNILFRLTPAPACFIIDCDAMRVQGQSALPQVDTEDWKLPAKGEEKATPAADAFKFGLLAIRLFARDQVSTDRTAIAALSPELGRLAAESLHLDPSRRPSPAQWIPALAATRSALLAAPTATFQRPDPPRISVPIPPVSPGYPQHHAQRPSPASYPPTPAPGRQPKRYTAAKSVGSLMVVVAVAIVALLGLHAKSNPAPSTVAQGSASGLSPSSQSESDEATQMSNLLDASSSSRQSLDAAVQDVGNCSGSSSDVTTISNVANQRTTEYNNAKQLSTGALPDGSQLKSDLVSALYYSTQADQDFLTWAQQQINDGGCTQTASYQAGVTASQNAVTAKNEFVQLWNPIATSQGLPTRSQSNI